MRRIRGVNDFFIPWIMRQLVGARHSCALDVGCGTGNLLDRLAQRFDSVTGVEPDPATEQIAAARFSSHAAVRIRCSTLADVGLGERFDAITLVAVLHHLPLEETLGRLRGMLSPGGFLVIVGCYREATIVDRMFSLVALAPQSDCRFRQTPQRRRQAPRRDDISHRCADGDVGTDQACGAGTASGLPYPAPPFLAVLRGFHRILTSLTS